MNERIRLMAVIPGLAIVGLGFMVAGCSEELHPVPFRSTVVKGVVRDGTRPVSRGWIEFYPVNGTVGNLRSAPLQADGSFEANGVAVGVNLVRLENADIESPLAARLFRSYGSPIRRDITERPAAPLDIDLVEEAIEFRRTHGQDAQSKPPGLGEPQ
jgi:hypothetical protein